MEDLVWNLVWKGLLQFPLAFQKAKQAEWGRQNIWRENSHEVFQNDELCESSASGRTNPKENKLKEIHI